MKELSLFNIINLTVQSLIGSKVMILIILELMVLLVNIFFGKIMNKKIVNIVTLIVSLILLGFYSYNYVYTLKVFLDNVSTKLLEMIYFPTTLEFVIVMILSIAIMIITLMSKKSSKAIKAVNSFIPLTISFLFLCIIETVNNSGVAFNEFSVFTNTTLMSLHEMAMGLFVAWIIGLILYKIDTYLISKAVKEVKETEYKYVTINSLSVDEVNKSFIDESLDMPKLKG